MAGRKRTSKKKKQGIILIAVVAIAAIIYGASRLGLFDSSTFKNLFGGKNDAEGELTVHFIDVGQGDCSLITSEGTAILIDTGEKENGDKICRYLKDNGVDRLDCFIITHPHSDHMGGASYIVDNVDIGRIVIPQVSDELVPTTKFYEKFLRSVKDKNLKLTAANPGDKIGAGDGELEIISPVNDYSDLNNYSVAAILTHGNNSFLFTGDIEKKAEKDILEAGYLRDIDVLKVPHHGSSGSSSDIFLEAVKPDKAVIMCDGQSYGHPHKKTMNRLVEYTEEIYRTDLNGTVKMTSDGEKIEVQSENR